MSRQSGEQERQIMPKRPRRDGELVPRLHSTMSIVPHVHGIDLMPTICGVHEHMSTWMSSLINAQDGCLQAVAQQIIVGHSASDLRCFGSNLTSASNLWCQMSIFKQKCTVTNRKNTVLPQGPLLLQFGPKLPKTPWAPLFTSINGFRGGSPGALWNL